MKRIAPEIGILMVLVAIAATFALCFIMEKLLGQYGAMSSIVGGLILGMEARKLAEKYSNDQKGDSQDN